METHKGATKLNESTGTGSPLGGVTFTTTDLTLKEKARIANMVVAMGGIVKNDLTADTNVLIVGNINTAKSKYCLKNRTDVTLLYPDDLYDIYRRFQERAGGLPMFTVQILDEYPWPIFKSCLFCLSRLRDVDNPCYAKNYITKLIAHFGGKSIASLTPKVTYLITDKREGKRYESAIDWKISPIHPKWIIDCCNCQRILDPSLYDISKIHDQNGIGKNSHKKFRNIVDYGSVRNNPIYASIENGPIRPADRMSELIKSTTSEENNGLFKGLIFSCFGFPTPHANKLSEILKSNGAEIQEEYDLSVTHVIIPSNFTFDEIPEKVSALQNISDARIVNEWFIERCLHYKKLCNDSWSLPPKRLHLDYKLKIHITGFSEIEHLHISKLIKNLNLTLQKELTQECNFLVANLSSLGLNKHNSPQLFTYSCNDILTSRTDIKTTSVNLTKKKINSAKKWNIAVVSLAFIWELSQTGVLPHVLDTQWCIFAPRSMRPASNFLEYARSVSGAIFHTVRPPVDEDAGIPYTGRYGFEESKNEGNDADVGNEDLGNLLESGTEESPTKLPVQLPSPRKNAARKWPKLVGTASESQLKSTGVTSAAIEDDDDENYNFRGKRRLVFAYDREGGMGEPGSYVEFEDDFGIEDIPMFKKRRK